MHSVSQVQYMPEEERCELFQWCIAYLPGVRRATCMLCVCKDVTPVVIPRIPAAQQSALATIEEEQISLSSLLLSHMSGKVMCPLSLTSL